MGGRRANWSDLLPVSVSVSPDRDGEMASSELQATIEISLEFHKFYNVDLFQRG